MYNPESASLATGRVYRAVMVVGLRGITLKQYLRSSRLGCGGISSVAFDGMTLDKPERADAYYAEKPSRGEARVILAKYFVFYYNSVATVYYNDKMSEMFDIQC